MDSKKMFLSWFLMLLWICSSSWVSEGFDFGQVLSVVKGGIDGGGGDNSMSCIQKLLPCQPYLKVVPLSPPPVTCCEPLKEMITGDSECLCQIFNNPVLLKNFNLTQEEALKLPKACGANADISVCKNEAAAPGGSPATPTTPGTSSNGSSTSNNTSNTNTNSTATASAAAANIGGPSSTVNLIIMLVAAAAAISHK